MTAIICNEVYEGTYMDAAGNTYKVFCIAEDEDTGERKVFYTRNHGTKIGWPLHKGVGAFVDVLKVGLFRYQGPHPRVLATGQPSPNVLIVRKGGAQNGKAN